MGVDVSSLKLKDNAGAEEKAAHAASVKKILDMDATNGSDEQTALFLAAFEGNHEVAG